jgi:hypothetical protein
MIIDIVLGKDMWPLFSGPPEETKRWLRDNPDIEMFGVRLGTSNRIVSREGYLKSYIHIF